MGVQAGEGGGLREGRLEIPEQSLERQQVNGLESERQRRAPGFYLGAWAAWLGLPARLPPGRLTGEPTSVLGSLAPSSWTKCTCLVLLLPQ